MKKFFKKIFILFFVLVIGSWIIIVIQLPENFYELAIIDKHRILAATNSPKLVLAGGSNLAFGIDSAEIQNKFHIPVVNMGLTAGVGLGRILDDISPFMNSGDILLIVPEYEYFINAWNGTRAAYELIFDMRQYRLLLSPYYGLPSGFSNYLSMHLFGHLIGIIQKTINNPFFYSYSRDGFNEYGDYIKHLEMETLPFGSNSDLGTLNQTYFNHFFQFVYMFSKREITVVLSYPCYEEQSFRNSAEFILKLDMAFRSKENLLVLSSPESYCYPFNYFYDLVYHLNEEGRSVRTDQLIQDLQASGLFSVILDK
jgi:hypothetical protein